MTAKHFVTASILIVTGYSLQLNSAQAQHTDSNAWAATVQNEFRVTPTCLMVKSGNAASAPIAAMQPASDGMTKRCNPVPCWS